jgi:hypothetical protein
MSISIRPKKELFFVLLAGTASIFALAPDAKALPPAVTTFQLTGANESFSTKQLSVDGIILNLSSGVGSTLPSNPLNINGAGFCSYSFVVNPSTRCGTSTTSSLQGFSLEFDKSVFLNQFNVSNFTNLTTGVITFTSGANVKQFNFNSTGIQSFSNPFLASAGSTVLVTTSATPDDIESLFRISDLQVQLAPEASVPGPLPLVGAGIAFAYSRKLRTRILRKAN